VALVSADRALLLCHVPRQPVFSTHDRRQPQTARTGALNASRLFLRFFEVFRSDFRKYFRGVFEHVMMQKNGQKRDKKKTKEKNDRKKVCFLAPLELFRYLLF
jgi:hypothetical protein